MTKYKLEMNEEQARTVRRVVPFDRDGECNHFWPDRRFVCAGDRKTKGRLTMVELKPCRKCGSDNVFIESTIAGFTLLYYVRCYECNHMGDYKNRPHEAVEAWNRRADDGHKAED